MEREGSSHKNAICLDDDVEEEGARLTVICPREGSSSLSIDLHHMEKMTWTWEEIKAAAVAPLKDNHDFDLIVSKIECFTDEDGHNLSIDDPTRLLKEARHVTFVIKFKGVALSYGLSNVSGKQNPHALKASLSSVDIVGAMAELLENGIQFTVNNTQKKIVELKICPVSKTVTIFDNGQGMVSSGYPGRLPAQQS
jgi:hypothetical protein